MDTTNTTTEKTVINSLPKYLIEIVRSHKDIDRGVVKFEISKTSSKVVGMKTKRSKIINFNHGDNREPLALMADIIKDIPEEHHEIAFHLVSTSGKIKKLVINEENTVDVGDDA